MTLETVELQTKVRGIDGSEQGEITLPELFAEKEREHLVYEVVQMQQAKRRAGTHSTKTRHFVSGGGSKPWRQKGTGNARAGSSRSPLWEAGAVVFGPLPRDYSYGMPAKARRVALKSVLADRQRGGNLTVVDSIALEEGKTKKVVAMLEALGIDDSCLIVNGEENEALERGARNLPKVKVLRTEGVNVYDVLRHKHLLLTKAAIDALKERLEK